MQLGFERYEFVGMVLTPYVAFVNNTYKLNKSKVAAVLAALIFSCNILHAQLNTLGPFRLLAPINDTLFIQHLVV
jgi:hypothetical protein